MRNRASIAHFKLSETACQIRSVAQKGIKANDAGDRDGVEWAFCTIASLSRAANEREREIWEEGQRLAAAMYQPGRGN